MKSEIPGRYVSYGGVLYIFGALQFIVAIILTALYYGPPRYNPVQDSISDLQAVHCGIFQGSQVCSPLNFLANSSLAIVGLLLIIGSFLIRSAFPPGSRRNLAFGLLIVAGLSAFANAFTPEDVTLIGDIVTALIVFVGANFGLIQIGRLMSGDPKWKRFGRFTEILGIIGIAALIFDGIGIGNVTGLIEWLIVAPVLLWMIFLGLRLSSRGYYWI